jgi:exopolyphosphatase/guanosine-5'-triphosphate,3'-diphosphate pyrophosphatase
MRTSHKLRVVHPPQPQAAPPEKSGLAYWMKRVLQECDAAAKDFAPDPVHDLRVALRRCRSMADGLMAVDSSAAWRQMKKAGKKLFQSLGDLRDTHILQEWCRKLAPAGDRVAAAVLARLAAREQEQKLAAQEALERFDHKQWKRWTKSLPQRARRLPPDGPVFEHLAVVRWIEARALHRRALRDRTDAAWHRLRIGLKRFRYTVENFLPRRHAAWGRDLKRLQDLLGEVHDLDVLRQTLRIAGPAYDAAARARWREAIERERSKRLDEYRRMMTGRASLWEVWRAGLPEGQRLEAAAMAHLAAWASFLDPDFTHTRHVARLALQLADGLAAAGIPKLRDALAAARARRILHAASLAHDVGKAAAGRKHPKESYRLIRALAPPLGWTPEELERVALVARLHVRGPRGDPRPGHKRLRRLLPADREMVLALAGVLRLANAFDHRHDAAVTRLEVESTPQAVVIRARGYEEDEAWAAVLAEQRTLLETVCGRPIIVRPVGNATDATLQQKLPFA